jgi:hypothetical protein
MSLLWYRHVMVMYSLVCYNDSVRVIYCCFNVLSDRTSSRSASIIVPVKFIQAINQKYDSIQKPVYIMKLQLGLPKEMHHVRLLSWLLFWKSLPQFNEVEIQ